MGVNEIGWYGVKCIGSDSEQGQVGDTWKQ